MIGSTTFRTALLSAAILLATADCSAQVPRPTVLSGTVNTTANTTASASVGQTITLNNTAFVVNAKKALASGVEFYTLKATTPKAKAVNYVHTASGYNPTVLTQAQYQTFFNTGKLSSFGTLRKHTANGTTYDHVIVGATAVSFKVAKKGSYVLIQEYGGGVTDMALANNDEGPSDANEVCSDACWWRPCNPDDELIILENPQCTNPDPCICNLLSCWDRCDEHIPLRGYAAHVFKSPKPVLLK